MNTAEELWAELRRRGVSERVLAALAAVPRERFVDADPPAVYANRPLPIGAGQTISQPYVVAIMVEALELGPDDRVLDVGTGSGWHAAVLAQLAGTVVGIERHASLAARARANLAAAGLAAVEVVTGDGSLGLPDRAPFHAINVAATAGGRVPPALEAQLADGGRLVAPVDDRLVVVRRRGEAFERRDAGAVRFVPLVEGGDSA